MDTSILKKKTEQPIDKTRSDNAATMLIYRTTALELLFAKCGNQSIDRY